MATLALAAVGSAIGGALLPSGIGMLGATLSGASIGGQIGALAGSYVDNALFGASGQTRRVEGPRLSELHVVASTEGAPIPRVYGRTRVGGQIIWAADIEEQATTTRQAQGGGKGATSSASARVSTTYSYFASFAVALAEGEISGLGRVWANGAEIDLSQVTYRLYSGSRDQQPDSLIAAHAGTDLAPAYRDTAYVVFDRLPLAAYGNRIPQLSFEVFRAAEPFADAIRGVVLIPGTGEFVYAPEPVYVLSQPGSSMAENVHTRQGGTDWSVSLDQLAATLPNVSSVSLVVSWFGTDLRAMHCRLMPGVERGNKTTAPMEWSVSGETRDTAYRVSQRDGRPAYGGTPSDASVVAAIRDLKSRGYAVTLTPFVLMDIPAENALPDPYGGAAQAPYPWRGRVTVDPAPGRPGTADKSPAARAQMAAFIGTASASDFSTSGDTVLYSGPLEWSFRRMVLHYAMLAKAAGGVETFVIGTEMKGLTTARSAGVDFPFVDALIALAADVKSILGEGTKVTYAADWSEYFGHHPPDGSGDVFFHLDPLWASSAIDAIGLDVYWPLSDWRDGRNHTDYLAGTHQIYDLDYLKSNVTGGEGYDWYYANSADREAQLRTPVTDGLGKAWVFRFKDIRSWWESPHHNRVAGAESLERTAWVPQSKPFWFVELGCGAVDKASNQPNIFIDPKSSENGLPYFSRGTRDDLVQRRYLRAIIETFDPASSGYAGHNPVSVLTGQRMVDLSRIHVYAWDARPFPAFPRNEGLWGDAPNWRLGHWLNGRFAGAPVGEMISAILRDFGFYRYDTTELAGTVAGYVIDRPMSAREALQPFELAYSVDTIERDGTITFRQRGAEPVVLSLQQSELVEEKPEAPLVILTRGQETDLPAVAKLKYLTAANDYRQAVAESRRLAGASGRLSQADVSIVLDEGQAAQIADTLLFEAWSSRERATFAIPPSMLALEPGDAIAIGTQSGTSLYRITGIGDRGVRECQALAFDPELYGAVTQPERPQAPPAQPFSGHPALLFLDLPLMTGNEPPHAGYVAAVQVPWSGGVAVYFSPETTGYRLGALAELPATAGTTLTELPSGPAWRIDRAGSVTVVLASGQLRSVSEAQLLAGANALAVRAPHGGWEILQFERADLVAPSTYRLSNLLRGQAGTWADNSSAIPANATVVLLDGALTRIDLSPAESRLPLYWRYGPSSRAIGDATFATTTHQFKAQGLRPLAPVHIRGRRMAAGDIELTWIRQTRVGGDDWEAAEVPLAEDTERFEVEILSGATIVRTLSVSQQSAVYRAVDQTADFGAPATEVSVRIAQLSAVYGRGQTATASV